MISAIDGDIIAYRCCHGSAYKADLDNNGVEDIFVDVERAKEGCDELIAEWTALAGTTEHLIVLSSGVNFRKLIMPEYKANRKKQPKPHGLDEVFQHIKDNYPTLIYHGLEADDTIGVLVSAPEYTYIGVSIDKDFNTIPGWLLNPNKDEKPWLNDPDEAAYNHAIQWLTGDSTDNYKGIPRIGPKKAEKILEGGENPIGCWDDCIEQAYADAGLSKEYCMQQRLVSEIFWDCNFDQLTGEIRLNDGDKVWLNLEEIENKYCKS